MQKTPKLVKLEILALLILASSVVGIFNVTNEQILQSNLQAQENSAQVLLLYQSKRMEAAMNLINQQAFQLLKTRDWSIFPVHEDYKFVREASDFLNTYGQIEEVQLTLPDGHIHIGRNSSDQSLHIQHERRDDEEITKRGVFRGLKVNPIKTESTDWTLVLSNSEATTLVNWDGQEHFIFSKTIATENNQDLVYHLRLNFKQQIQNSIKNHNFSGLDVKVNDHLAFSQNLSFTNTRKDTNYSGLGTFMSQDPEDASTHSTSINSRFHNLSIAYMAFFPIAKVDLADVIKSKEFVFLGMGMLGLLMLYGIFKVQIQRMKMEKNIDAQSLALANAKLGIMLNQPDSFLYQTDTSGKLLDISSNVKFVLGYTPSEMLGRPLEYYFKKKCIPAIDVERKDECIEMMTHFDDTVVVELNENFHLGDRLEKKGKFGIARNITKVVNVEKENHLQHQNKGALLDAIPDAIITLDYDGKLSEWKLPSSYVFPFDFKPETGAVISALFPPGLATEIQLAFNQAGKTDNFNHRELCYTYNNKTCYFETRTIRLSSDHVMILIRDISSQKLIELDLEKGKIEAERSSRVKDQFISIISHELKTPLNGILGMSHLLEDTGLSTEQKDYLNTLKESAQNLNGIISDILDFSKIVNGQVKVTKTWFQIGELIDYVCKSHSTFAEEKGLKFVYSVLMDDSRKVYQDFGKTAQILSQIIHNAIKFTSNGSVHLQVSGDEERLQFKITDTGIGMDEDRLEELFKPFTQIDNSDSRKYGGMGLGLALSTRLIHILGGSIQASSETGKGSSFTISIPLNDGQKHMEWVPKVNRSESIVVINSNPITCSVVYKKLEIAGFDTIREFEDCLNGKEKPDYILINKNSMLNEEQLKCIQFFAGRTDVLTVAFRINNSELRDVPLPIQLTAEIILDGNASNLKEHLQTLRA
jgi:signal transduction histidine kinase